MIHSIRDCSVTCSSVDAGRKIWARLWGKKESGANCLEVVLPSARGEGLQEGVNEI